MKEELKELRAKGNKTLLEELKRSYEDLRNLRFQAKMRELKNVVKVKKTKRKIAQILTVLREKLMEEVNEKETTRENSQR